MVVRTPSSRGSRLRAFAAARRTALVVSAIALGAAAASVLQIACVLPNDVVGVTGASGQSGTADNESAPDSTADDGMSNEASVTGTAPPRETCDGVCSCEASCSESCDPLSGGCVWDCSSAADCDLACGSGDCVVDCTDDATCDVACDGPNCVMDCTSAERCAMATSNSNGHVMTCVDTPECVLDCPAGDCQLDCSNATTCRITNCATDCLLTCSGVETCDNSCNDPLAGCITTV